MLILPENMREEVRQPFGKVLSGKAALETAKKSAKPLISVGDQCGFDLISSGCAPDMLIFDFKIKRQEIPAEMKKAFAPHAKNAFVVLSGPGQISDALEVAVEKMLSEGTGAVLVLGEDDLSALLVMAFAQSGTLVYGQPNEGMVIVQLGNKEIMKKAMAFLDRMEKA